MLEGIDVSHWSGKIDYSIAKKAGIAFSIFKATDFDSVTKVGFLDSQFINNWANTRAQQIINGSYHWLQPKIDPTIQADYYLKFWKAYPCDLAPILDFEDQAINSPADMLWRAQVWLEKGEAVTGRVPIVYTSSGYMRQLAPSGGLQQSKAGFLHRHPLWLAQYTSWPFPSVPKPWTAWTFWQYSQTGKGQAYGSPSAGMDLNRFNGSLDDLKVLTTTTDAIPSPLGEGQGEVPTPTTNTALRAKVLTATLNVRSGPGLSYPTVGTLKSGDLVDAMDFDGNSWLQIAPGKYAAYCVNGTKYMDLL